MGRMNVKTLPSGKKKWTCPYCGTDVVRESEAIKRGINGHVSRNSGNGHGESNKYPKDWVRRNAERIGWSGFTCKIEIDRINEDAEVVASIDLFGTEDEVTFPVDKFLSETPTDQVTRKGKDLVVTKDDGTEIIINLPHDLL